MAIRLTDCRKTDRTKDKINCRDAGEYRGYTKLPGLFLVGLRLIILAHKKC